jgi:hypothetical protein
MAEYRVQQLEILLIFHCYRIIGSLEIIGSLDRGYLRKVGYSEMSLY